MADIKQQEATGEAMARQQDYYSLARNSARKLWDAVNELKALQNEYNALDYGTTLEAGTGENDGLVGADIGAAVFATTDAIQTLFASGHATNLAKLL